MGTDFTGTDAWVATLTGPADTDDLTGASVTDMGVQLANRTTFLGARLDDTYVRRHLARIENTDTGGTNGGGQYEDYGSSVTSTSWTNHSALWVASQTLPNDNGYLVLDFHGYVANTNTALAEVRLTAASDDGPHARIDASATAFIHLTHVSPSPGSGVVASPAANVGLQLRADETDGAVSVKGWARLDIWHIELVEIP